MTLRLAGSTSGYTEIDAPAVAGNNTLLLPTGNGSAHQILKNGATAGSLEYGPAFPSGNGTNGQYLQTNGSGTLSWSTSGLPAQALTAATSVSASGTSIDFTGIPSTVKRITVMYSLISTTGNGTPRVQLGTSSGVTTSGYTGTSKGSGNTNLSAGFDVGNGFASSSNVFSGLFIIALLGSNTWTTNGMLGVSTTGADIGWCSGTVTLGGTLDRVRFANTGGDNFDAGTINIMYEG